MHCSPLATLLTLVILVKPLFAYQTIAHRGLFHDVNDHNALAGNSVNAMYRAEALGPPSVEFDLRLSSDNQVLVFHDMISNRATSNDNYGGRLDAVDVGSHPAILVKSRPANSWIGTGLKSFGRNGRIVLADGAQKLETLDSMLSHFKNLNNPNFWLILDIQDPVIFSRAAAAVNAHGLSRTVFLKFFATKAINSKGIKYNGANTCYQYARKNHLSDLQIIPQINDGELHFEGEIAYLNVFNTKLSVREYLQCWADAQKAHSGNGAALMPIVSASVPANNEVAFNTARDTLAWAKSAGRKTMSILPNPDAGRIINTQCTFVKAARFDESARKAKLAFVEIAKPDYVVLDFVIWAIADGLATSLATSSIFAD
ncbi:hypothetical protein D6D10_02747 [Aureobasidium pullulans]|uniref:GP-PDE domain-containing protein n=1 Tax=Aureobasidium pullulans TaxID=5580 RepID=A0A4S9F1Y2_AURPU|nr:hypothetical protein D6D10_02747 [Aureobasidium pullulans]